MNLIDSFTKKRNTNDQYIILKSVQCSLLLGKYQLITLSFYLSALRMQSSRKQMTVNSSEKELKEGPHLLMAVVQICEATKLVCKSQEIENKFTVLSNSTFGCT